MATHNQVVRNFAEQKPNPRYKGAVTWRGKNITCEGGIIRSFNQWPMAKLLRSGKDPLFLKNGDPYSTSTSCHQALVQRHCKGPTVSFSALRSAGISDATSLTMNNIVDYRLGQTTHIVKRDGKFFLQYRDDEFTPPKQGMFVKLGNHWEGGEYGVWHILGAVVLRWQNKYLLCSLDHGNYFVSELAHPVTTVSQAFDWLKPMPVKMAEAEGIEVLRQGEWFFIPTTLTDREVADLGGFKYLKDMRRDAGQGALPHDSRTSNHHACRWLNIGDGIYAKGTVYHRDPYSNESTGEHPSVKLGDTWHVAIRNTAIQSWSVGGRFD